VAAEASGFRACLRCRPDRLPPTASLEGVPRVVVDALRIVNEGALDNGSEDDLGRRLGISSRQLRRLFLDHVGATPDGVARSRRAHFARRLLDETDLPIARVGFAAGFSSVRQMNRVMLETFRASPSELRSRRRNTDRLVADGGLLLRIPYEVPFNFTAMLDFLRPRAIPGVEAISNTHYRRTITTCGHPGALELSDARDGQHLILRAHVPTFDSLIDDVARVRRLFGLDQPSPVALPPLTNDLRLVPLVKASAGVRVPGAWDRFEVAVRIVIGQGIAVRAASTLTGRLVERFGSPIGGLGELGLTHVFPSAERLARASVLQLSGIGLPARRSEAIRALARAYSDGNLSLEATQSLESLLERLVALPGIGQWTANLVALRAAGELDAYPAGDLGLRQASARLRRNGGRLDSEKQVLERAEAWRPYRGVAAMCLWRSLSKETGSR
jgi:AraC family transcriptional regulator of adaptative response / DNA-3-methyladenine glycosylase II